MASADSFPSCIVVYPGSISAVANSCNLGCHVQISKKLACGDVGNGALAEAQAIADAVREAVGAALCLDTKYLDQ